MMKRRISVLAFAVLLMLSHGVGATVFAPAEFSELIVAARTIAHGRILELRPQVTDDRWRVETLVTMQVSTYLKGDLGPTITFRVPGGQIGRYRTIVLDAPQFAPGEEVVLLLSARGPSIPYVLGLSQGVFRVVSDAVSGERRVAPAPILGEGSEWKRITRGDPARQPILLTDFAGRVQRILGAQR